jgi:starch synthase
LRYILHDQSRFPNAFSFPNGLNRKDRLASLGKKKISLDHRVTKAILQKTYFDFKELDDSIALFGFVGRITEQKGVHLILDVVDDLIREANGKVQVLMQLTLKNSFFITDYTRRQG